MKLLSLLVCLAMMLSGSYAAMAEDSAAVPATVVTVRDAVISVMGEEYVLNPSITLGVSAEDDSVLIDFGMPLGENTLFPVQARIDEGGLGVLLGQSGTAYTFTKEFFDSVLDGAEISAEIYKPSEAYFELLESMPTSTNTEAQNAALTAKLFELIGDVPSEEVTFFANEQEQTGKKIALSLDQHQISELMDASIEQLPEDYREAYFNYLNQSFTLAGGPEISGYEDILTMSGMTMSIDGELSYNDTSAVGDFMLHMTVDPNAIAGETGAVSAVVTDESGESAATADAAAMEPITMDMPMNVTVHSAGHVVCTITMTPELLGEDGMYMDMIVTQKGNDVSVDAFATMEEDFAMQMSVALSGYGTDDSSTVISIVAEDPDNMFGFYSETSGSGDASTTGIEINYEGSDGSFGASFSIDVAPGEIADRISEATVSPINSPEDAEGSTGLMMAAMSMMGDVEKLMNDESIAALIELYNTAVAAAPEATVTEVELADGTEIATVSAPELIAEFGYLPEGYTLTESETYEGGYYSSYIFDSTVEDDEYHSSLYIDIMSYLSIEEGGPESTTYAVIDGEMQTIDGAVISIQRYEDGSVYGYYDTGSANISITYYDSDLTDEEIIKIASGITLEEAA